MIRKSCWLALATLLLVYPITCTNHRRVNHRDDHRSLRSGHRGSSSGSHQPRHGIHPQHYERQ